MTDEPVAIGTVVTRDQMQEIFGGGRYGGIVQAAKTPNVLIYSDPAVGEPTGYIDGWLPEEDEGDPIFEYTGHGEGNQTLDGRAGRDNRAVYHHIDDGRTLRVFKATGQTVPGTGIKLHRYIGAFELDVAQRYVVRRRKNKKGIERRVIVFRLKPTGPALRLSDDFIQPAKTTSATIVPADETTSAIVEPENNKNTKSRRSAVPEIDAERHEARLSDQFQKFLEGKGHSIKRIEIKIGGSGSSLMTDLYDETAHVLYELKGTTRREAVRMAIGQLLDYRRHVKPANPTLAVLLPGAPHDDLKDLLNGLGIELVYWDGTSFSGLPAC